MDLLGSVAQLKRRANGFDSVLVQMSIRVVHWNRDFCAVVRQMRIGVAETPNMWKKHRAHGGDAEGAVKTSAL
jgi:hypothetical protein